MSPTSRFVISSITLAALWGMVGSARDEPPFRAGEATDYAHQTSDQVTIGAKPFDNEQLTAEVFGKKTDLMKYGVLPVLVVIKNGRQKSLDLQSLEVNLVAADGRHATAVNPEDIPYLATTGHHGKTNGVPLPVPLPKKKNPLSSPEIVTRAFAAKMLPPGDSASGFFYFEAKSEPGDKLYLNGLKDARSGQEILYFEFPLAK